MWRFGSGPPHPPSWKAADDSEFPKTWRPAPQPAAARSRSAPLPRPLPVGAGNPSTRVTNRIPAELQEEKGRRGGAARSRPEAVIFGEVSRGNERRRPTCNPQTYKTWKAEPQLGTAWATPERKWRFGGRANRGPLGGASALGGALAARKGAWPGRALTGGLLAAGALPAPPVRLTILHRRRFEGHAAALLRGLSRSPIGNMLVYMFTSFFYL